MVIAIMAISRHEPNQADQASEANPTEIKTVICIARHGRSRTNVVASCVLGNGTGNRSITGGEKPDTITVRGVLKKDTLATVHVSGHAPFERVRFIGFTNSQSMKTHLPWELSGMVILEDESKTQFLVRAKDIKMIIVAPGGNHGTPTEPEF